MSHAIFSIRQWFQKRRDAKAAAFKAEVRRRMEEISDRIERESSGIAECVERAIRQLDKPGRRV